MKIADAEAFGNELRTRRKELGYTQAYIAEFTGFSVRSGKRKGNV